MVDSVPPINLPRVATKDLAVHIKDTSGYWHRLHASTVKTSCGQPVDYYRQDNRVGRTIEHPLAWSCGCWTDVERLEADQNWFEKFGKWPTADDF